MTDEKLRTQLDRVERHNRVYSGLLCSLACAFGTVIGSCHRELNLQIDSKVCPEIRDVNQDGFGDIVLRRNSGEELVLYGREDGSYGFEPRNP